MKQKKVMWIVEFALACSLMTSEFYRMGSGFLPVFAEAAEENPEVKAFIENVKFDAASEWSEINDGSGAAASFDITSDKVPAVNTAFKADILLPAVDGQEKPVFQGSMKMTGVLCIDEDWHWAQSNDYAEVTSDSFTLTTVDGKSYYKASVSSTFGAAVSANDGSNKWKNDMAYESVVTAGVRNVKLKLVGYLCDYSGDIVIANARLEEPAAMETAEPVVLSDFAADACGWETEQGWDYSHGKETPQLNGTTPCESPEIAWDEASQALRVFLDYSKNSASGWSEAKIKKGLETPVSIKNYNLLTFDVIYPSDAAFKFKAFASSSDGTAQINQDVSLEEKYIEDIPEKEGFKKAMVHIKFSPKDVEITDLTLGIIGSNSSFQGDVWLDNITLSQSSAADDYVKITSRPKETADIAKIEKMPESVKLVNKNATDSAKALASYLHGLAAGDQVLFGHQNSIFRSVRDDGETSDVRDVTGAEAGLFGIDSLSLSGCEMSTTDPAEAVRKSVEVSKKAYENGSMVTLSCHMPNFTNKNIIVTEQTDGSKTYDFTKCDFRESQDCSNNCAEQILPGGDYNDCFRAYLDIITEYAKELQKDDIPLLLRPFHENSGGWFWWGTSTKPEVYRALWRYTVDYLEKNGVNNILYVYSPNGPVLSEEEYLTRYPGDEYVDVLAFDFYDDYADVNTYTGDNFFDDLDKTCKVVSSLAKSRGKIAAIAESGIRITGAGKDSLMIKDNPAAGHDWYKTLLETAEKNDMSYFLLWANFSAENFFVPYKYNEEFGQEMINEFIDFYNDERSIFGNGTEFAKAAEKGAGITNSGYNTVSGYMIQPVDYTVIKEAVTFRANVKNADEVFFEVKTTPSADPVVFPAKYNAESGFYEAAIDTTSLQKLGETELAVVTLYAKQTGSDPVPISFSKFICLNKDKSVMPEHVFDDFEFYYGNNDLFQSAYGEHNSASGCSSEVSLDASNKASGEYGGTFSYKLSYRGSEVWTGGLGRNFADMDSSKYNAISMWVKPDGNGQKMVVQINGDYEAYLTNFGKTTEAKYVTIPFTSFKKKGDSTITLNDEKNITSFKLWCNSMPENYKGEKDDNGFYTIEGSFGFDDIQAVKISDSDIAKADADGLIISDQALKDLNEKQPSETPDTQKPDTQKPGQTVTPENSDEKQPSETPDTQKPDTQKPGTSVTPNQTINPGQTVTPENSEEKQPSTATDVVITTEDDTKKPEQAEKPDTSAKPEQSEVPDNSVKPGRAAEKITLSSTLQLSKTKNGNYKLTLPVSGTTKLKVSAEAGKVIWKSSNKKIATVNQNGNIVAKKNGTVTITVKSEDGAYATRVTVKVVAPKSYQSSFEKAAVKISKPAVKGSKKAAVIKYSVVEHAAGYVITYSTSGKFTRASTKQVSVKNGNKKRVTLKNLKAGKNYYVKVTAYTKVKGKVVYAKPSNVMKFSTK